ncbi:MAG: AraC family transcriptional regulator, partial [Burkholderiales bacterium]|nr:AraC family transcriptional regulator [Opitutaceae bacterium]
MRAPLPDPFSPVMGGDEETRASADYFFDNRSRGAADDVVIQQTLAGAGFLEDSTGRRLVPIGHAMLFTHHEPSAYGYPAEANTPYRLRYVAFRLAGLRAWFDRIRAEFGAVVRMPVDGAAAGLMSEALRRFRARDFRDRIQETELMHQLLATLYREQVAATQTHDPIEYGRHYLRDNFRSPLNLKELAARCGVSREHFIRRFGQRYGEP